MTDNSRARRGCGNNVISHLQKCLPFFNVFAKNNSRIGHPDWGDRVQKELCVFIQIDNSSTICWRSWLMSRCVMCSGLTSEPTHLHHPAHTQLAQDPLTGHTLVISTVPVAHTPLIGKSYVLHNCETCMISQKVHSLGQSQTLCSTLFKR